MNGLPSRWLPVAVLITAMGLLVGSLVWVGRGGWRPSVSGPGGMMGGAAIAGQGPVHSLGDAKQAAARFADRWGLTIGEVMQFDNGFYAELVEPSGALATEVLIDPSTGAVQIEYGPAMMWNTAFGMHAARPTVSAVGAEQAQTIADQWLAKNRPGQHAGDAEEFPGYYTLHTLNGDQIVGMLSVNAGTGAVWYHTWHGRFITMSD
jgi:hypothetical protein